MNKNFMLFYNNDIYTNPIQFHSHDYFEIYFFMNGYVEYYVENEEYDMKRGDVLIIPPGKLHRPVIEENFPYERYVLWILNSHIENNEGIKKFIEELNRLTKEKNTRLVSFFNQSQKDIRLLLDKAFENYKSNTELSNYVSESCIIMILNELRIKLTDALPAVMIQKELVHRVIIYLNENFRNNPSLEEISAKFFVSKYYLSHKFKEYTKTTIHNYILMKKINLAKELLQKGVSPQEISNICGFSTYANFYKAFKERTGVSPRNYKI